MASNIVVADLGQHPDRLDKSQPACHTQRQSECRLLDMDSGRASSQPVGLSNTVRCVKVEQPAAGPVGVNTTQRFLLGASNAAQAGTETYDAARALHDSLTFESVEHAAECGSKRCALRAVESHACCRIKRG